MHYLLNPHINIMWIIMQVCEVIAQDHAVYKQYILKDYIGLIIFVIRVTCLFQYSEIRLNIFIILFIQSTYFFWVSTMCQAAYRVLVKYGHMVAIRKNNNYATPALTHVCHKPNANSMMDTAVVITDVDVFTKVGQ